MEYKTINVSVESLLLDPNNYRFLDMKGYTVASPSRYHEDTVQKRARTFLERDGFEELRALKESLQINGYVPIEILVVKPYAYKPNTYVVVEGNRRVAAIKWLQEDANAGVIVSSLILEAFNNLSVVAIDSAQGEETIQLVLMGVRHVSGIKQWGGYQRAKIILEMVDERGLTLPDAAKKLGMTVQEATRRYRAIKVLQQMMDDDEFGPYATTSMYRLFHEAISITSLREWLGWNNKEYVFRNDVNRAEFYKLLVPYKPETDDDVDAVRAEDPKIKTYLDVRSLRDIIGNEDAEKVLLDPQTSLADAVAVIKANEGVNWPPKVREAKRALERIQIHELKKMTQDEVQPLRELLDLIRERLDDWDLFHRR